MRSPTPRVRRAGRFGARGVRHHGRVAVADAPSLPPGPTAPPLLQTAQVLLRPEPYLRAARAQHGDVFTLRTAVFGDFVVACGPDAVRDVFTAPPGVALAGVSNAPLAPLVGERSVLVLDGPEHLRQRRLLLPPFHGEKLRRAGTLIERATVREVEGWGSRRPFALLPAMQTITLEVVLRVVFGVRDAARMEELARRIRDVLEPVGGRVRMVLSMLASGRDETSGLGAGQRRFLERRAALDRLLYAHIAQRRRAHDLEQSDDVLSMLLLARDEDGAAMTDAEVRDELVTLLLAGHETTATALAWTFERLLRTPHALARVQEELARPDGGHAYLDAVCKEALRARPVLPSVGRYLTADHAVGGHLLPAGTSVMPSIALMHRADDVFDDAHEFRPERFLGDDAPSGYAWIPFGGGPRRCLGASFALLEMRVVVATVLRRAHLTPVGDAEQTVRRGITLTPEHGARVIARVR